jgi:hypothetical protein
MPEEGDKCLLSIEDGFEIMNKLLPTGAFCAVIWDSVAASNPKELINKVEENGLDGRHIALTAAALTTGLAVYAPGYRKSSATIFFINHKRVNLANIANPFMAKFGDKESTPGGTAFKHHADLRIDLKPMDYITRLAPNSLGKRVQIKIGQNIKIKFVKNRVGDPYGENVLVFRKGIGFDVVSSVIKRAIDNGVVIRKSTGPCHLASDPNITAPSYEGFWNLVHANPNLLESLKGQVSGGAYIPKLSGQVDLTAATRELTVKELVGSDSPEEDVVEEDRENEVKKEPVDSDSILDELTTTKSEETVQMPEPPTDDNGILPEQPEISEKVPGIPETVKRKVGRPPKVK